MRIVVVRHGEAEPKKGWSGPDDARPLVGRGRRQAERLGKVVGGPPPTRVISSPALRCRETVEPLAVRYGLEVELSELLATGAGAEAAGLCRKLAHSEPEESNLVLCTHREVLVEMLPSLSAEYGCKLGHHPPGAKGGAWTLRFQSGRMLKVHYTPPAA